MKKLKKIKFQGKVQNVFFRAFAKKYAKELNICGYAKNLEDGSVEIVLLAEEKNINLFLKKIRKNPGYGKIEKEKILPIKNNNNIFLDFKIL